MYTHLRKGGYNINKEKEDHQLFKLFITYCWTSHIKEGSMSDLQGMWNMQKSFLRKRQGVNPLEKCKYKIFIALYTRIIILKPSDLPHVTPGSVF